MEWCGCSLACSLARRATSKEEAGLHAYRDEAVGEGAGDHLRTVRWREAVVVAGQPCVGLEDARVALGERRRDSHGVSRAVPG